MDRRRITMVAGVLLALLGPILFLYGDGLEDLKADQEADCIATPLMCGGESDNSLLDKPQTYRVAGWLVGVGGLATFGLGFATKPKRRCPACMSWVIEGASICPSCRSRLAGGASPPPYQAHP